MVYKLFQQGGNLGVPQRLLERAHNMDPKNQMSFEQKLAAAKDYINDYNVIFSQLGTRRLHAVELSERVRPSHL